MTGAGSDSVISVRGLSKCFKVYRRPHDMAWELLTGKPRHTDFWALRDISFEIRRGEVIGLIGRNGSGKSTLLKILTGVLDKTAGAVETRGKISAILELGSGFHADYTGRENIIRGGLVVGMSRAEIEGKLESIIEFSGLRDFIDRPFRTYSSGMQARLTFATATAIDPDIFIVDEALATGDAFFVQKCLGRIRHICHSGCTAIMVSHSTPMLATISDRVIWLDQGVVRRCGRPVEVIREYDLLAHAESNAGEGSVARVRLALNTPVPEGAVAALDGAFRPEAAPNEYGVYRRGPVRITRVELLDGHGRPGDAFRVWDPMTVRVWYACDGPPPAQSLGLALAVNRASDVACVIQCNTHNFQHDDDMASYHEEPFRKAPAGSGFIEARMDPLQLCAGDYLLSVGLLPNLPLTWDFYEYHHLAYQFRVVSNGWAFGATFRPVVAWRHAPDATSAHAA
jgi:ABC-type polysaccharide/polyol phosphate transport system ATPase subunit